jgi:hypothetical protein
MPQGKGGRFGGDALDPARTMGIERVPWVSRQNGTVLAVSTGYTPPAGPVHPPLWQSQPPNRKAL